MRRRIKPLFLWGAAVALLVAAPLLAQSTSITGSGHDLTVNGPGPVRATSEIRLCIFCHTSHAASPAVPLWNQQLSASTYSLYSSSTYNQINSPSISQRSKLCLSCHDGTVAAGQTVANGLISTTGFMNPQDVIGAIGLSADHPIDFNMPAIDDGEIKLSLTAQPPSTSDPAVNLYNNTIECVTCHEPHNPGLDVATQFMVRSNINSAICTACHDTSRGILNGWVPGTHATATNTVALTTGLPYPAAFTVSTNACESCHVGHNSAGTGARLLRGVDQATCATCHAGSGNLTPPLLNIMSELTKAYAHPVLATPTPPHDPAEAIPVVSSRHSKCADCHNPHASQADSGRQPHLPWSRL